MRQIAGIGSDDGPLGYEPARMRASKPGRAMWSMPLMPYMSPAAIGLMAVRLRGVAVRSKRSPSAASTASGQPRPLDELMLTTSPS